MRLHIYYCTSESEIWLDIERVGRYIYTSRRRVKMLPTSAISSHFSLFTRAIMCLLPTFTIIIAHAFIYYNGHFNARE